MRARRALLYMPGDDMSKIRKATTLGVDCICMDMEDGVAQNRKAAARQTILEALHTLEFGAAEKLARINAVGSGYETDDLTAALAGHPDGIVIPKIENAEQIRWASERIRDAEAENGWQPGSVGLIVVVESAAAIVRLPEIASADARLQAMIFGAEDFAHDVGATRSADAWEVFYARSAVVTHAAAFGLQAIDMVTVDFHNLDRVRQEAIFGAHLGFSGKQIIHPNQVKPVQDAFTPSDTEIEQARQIIAADAAHQQGGRGAYVFDGKMVDAPIVKAAERVLARARAAGKDFD